MARIFLDECVDRRLALHLTGHEVSSSFSRRWQGLPDGALLQRCAGEVDAFITTDKNLQYQQDVSALPFGIVVVRAGRGRLSDLLPIVNDIATAAGRIQPGEVMELVPGQ